MRYLAVFLAALTGTAFANETSTLFGSRSWQFATPAERAVRLDVERYRHQREEDYYEKYTGIHGGTWSLSSVNVGNMSSISVTNADGNVWVDGEQDIWDDITQDADSTSQFLNVDLHDDADGTLNTTFEVTP